ncbi:phosphoglucosamine mutase [bacterium]|nr:phosphoglucosamine mutase [bacterium]
MFTGLMVGVSGIRGVVGEGMTPEVAMLWSGGFGTWVKGGKVVIGRDPRPSGEMINFAVKAGLCAAGCDVDDVGVVPTPEAALAVERRNANGGIIITASHNPQQWNALKFVRPDGRMLTLQDFKELEYIVTEGPLRSVGWDKLGTVYDWDGADYMYLSSVTGMGILNLERIKSKRFKVAIDCVNGAGSKIYPELLEAFGCDVYPIHSDGSGIFPHPPEPKPENLGDLCELVVREHCNIGFAVDPDGDRLVTVDEKGVPVGEELTLALAIQAILEYKQGPVVINSLTSQVIEDVAQKFGVECHRTRVGEANVAAGMKEFNAVAGGEGNGGIIYPELHLVRDGGVGMAILLNYLSSSKKQVSELKSAIPEYKMLKVSYPLKSSDPEDIIRYLSRCYPYDQSSLIDGLRISYEDGWIQTRPSNTEPIMRVFSEFKTEERASEMMKDLLENINKSVGDDRFQLE